MLRRQLRLQTLRAIEAASVLPLLDLTALALTSPTAREFALERFIPRGEVTLFTGAGGAGKSLFGQQLCTCIAAGVPFLPGVATAGDIMRGLDLGLSHFKFFPAMAAGGIPALKALADPFAMCRFCPTGGISLASAPDWLALEPVLCVGGSWVTGKGPIDPTLIEANAREAAGLRRARTPSAAR